jgi:drug/metabolite transporter (DMT)-like permease
MVPALITTVFFALSVIMARRSITYVGSQRANFARQIIALILLGAWAHSFGEGLRGETFFLFFLSGVVGFGIGDWALFEAFPRIGSGMTVLLCQCFAPPIAAVTERLWLGTQMTSIQIASSAVILAGVALALAPGPHDIIPAGHRLAGIGFGIIAAAGQAGGAVLSRYAFLRAHAIGFSLDGITAAYQRLWGGALSIGLLLLVGSLHMRWRSSKVETTRPNWRGAWPSITLNALAGATIGVSCYQWALKSAPSSIVLPIVATTPLVVMFFAFAFEGVLPTKRAAVGSLLAVFGVIILVRSS